jgi:hypothetical protein
MSALHQITERGMALMDGMEAEQKERLVEAHDLFSLMEDRFPELLKDLERERTKRQIAR